MHRLTSKFWLFKQFAASAWNRGLARTLRIALYELWYDRKFRANTASIVPVENLDFDEEARRHAQAYFPSSYLFMCEALSHKAFDWQGRIFVDYGCGMGRALLFASTLPLRKIIGVELSPSLAAMARRNLQRYYATTRKSAPEWSVVNADARQFDIPADASIFYFFNPFDADVLGEVADRIVTSVRQSPRRCLVVYIKPVHESVFIQRGFARLAAGSADFSLFSFDVVT